MKVNDVFSTNAYGNLKILEVISRAEAKIEFISTGYIAILNISNIKKGKAKDKFSPSVHGVGYIGDGENKVRINKVITKSYSVWAAMIQRCYDKSYQERYPTYKGCSVSKEWHNYQTFCSWFHDNYIEGCALDKDVLVDGNKIYSKETCIFIKESENNEKANAKNYCFLSPKDEKIKIYNLHKFCQTNGLNKDGMYRVYRGHAASYKGWRKSCL